jgi:hypothetical protein
MFENIDIWLLQNNKNNLNQYEFKNGVREFVKAGGEENSFTATEWVF